jgi:hypothetical protein
MCGMQQARIQSPAPKKKKKIELRHAKKTTQKLGQSANLF